MKQQGPQPIHTDMMMGENLTSGEVQGEDRFVWECHQHSYGNSEWRDLLTALDGKSITYDANGNPTKYYNGATMTWQNGRQLGSYSQGGKTYSYEYDVNGLWSWRWKLAGVFEFMV